MFFDFKNFFNKNKDISKKEKSIKEKSEEISKIWNEKDESLSTDVDGSYTGNPKDSDYPVQDADDL